MTKLTESKKAQFGGVGIAALLGMVTQGLDIRWAAVGVVAITVVEIIAWAVQDKEKQNEK